MSIDFTLFSCFSFILLFFFQIFPSLNILYHSPLFPKSSLVPSLLVNLSYIFLLIHCKFLISSFPSLPVPSQLSSLSSPLLSLYLLLSFNFPNHAFVLFILTIKSVSNILDGFIYSIYINICMLCIVL